MVFPRLVVILLPVICLQQWTEGLLYGLVPEDYLKEVQRQRLLHQQVKILQEIEELQKAAQGYNRDQVVSRQETNSAKQIHETRSQNLLSAIRRALLYSNSSPSFKYSFVG